MREVLGAIRATAPHRVAISDCHGELTYGELAEAIDRLAASLHDCPAIMGLLMPRDRWHVIADLALAALGRTIVPLPDFFSAEQWRHMVADAAMGAVLTTPEGRERLAEVDVPIVLCQPAATGGAFPPAASRRIIYTSGTTGRPKGVVLEDAALAASLAGLQQAVGASSDDVHLSALPFSLLLEQLAGILLPLNVGARIHIAASPQQVPAEAELVGATTSVLVPELLAVWVAWLRQTGRIAPAGLRFVAVGGAPVGQALADAAWELGLPVHEGYGLSECCSVVAVNRPGQRRAATVGRPLDGVAVTIEDDEIVVRGPTIMAGYLGGKPAHGVWRTGDLGRLDENGHLVVFGRKDDVVVTSNGRNIHPEWIEPLLLTDPAIRACAVIAGQGGLKAVVVPASDAPRDWLPRLHALTAQAPAYAQPVEVAVITAAAAAAHTLFTPDGRPRRRRIAQYLSEGSMSFYETLVAATTPDRQAFLSIPLIGKAVAEGVDMPLYLSFLTSAYHHVRYTVPLLHAALAACQSADAILAEGLRHYVEEEIGHDEWILNDITALGGDAEAVRRARSPLAVRAMVATAFHLIREDGPYSLLGMVHVLEGMSVALAVKAAQSIRNRVSHQGGGGFSYLTSHGGLDIGHVDDFARLLDAIDTPRRRALIMAAAKDFYTLYGNVFRTLEVPHAA